MQAVALVGAAFIGQIFRGLIAPKIQKALPVHRALPVAVGDVHAVVAGEVGQVEVHLIFRHGFDQRALVDVLAPARKICRRGDALDLQPPGAPLALQVEELLLLNLPQPAVGPLLRLQRHRLVVSGVLRPEFQVLDFLFEVAFQKRLAVVGKLFQPRLRRRVGLQARFGFFGNTDLRPVAGSFLVVLVSSGTHN